MVQSRGGTGFLFKPTQVVGIIAGGRPDQLEGNVATEPFVARAKDFSHPSGANFFEDPIVPDELPDHSDSAKLGQFYKLGMVGGIPSPVNSIMVNSCYG